VLREIADSRFGAAGFCAVWVRGDELSVLEGAADGVVVPYLVQGAVFAAQGYCDAGAVDG
jgi:hypothetical protein